MEKEPKEIMSKPRRLEEGFDPGKELWERLVDDAIERGGPCMATVENLLTEACELPANPDKKTTTKPKGSNPWTGGRSTASGAWTPTRP